MKEKFPLFLALLMMVGTVSCGPKNEAIPSEASTPSEHKQTFPVLSDDQVDKIARTVWYSGLESRGKAVVRERSNYGKDHPKTKYYWDEYTKAREVVFIEISLQFGGENNKRVFEKIKEFEGHL